MGCKNSKTDERTPNRGKFAFLLCLDRRRNQVVPLNIPTNGVGAAVNEGTPMINLQRQTEETVLKQLMDEGIVTLKGNGGVAFIIDVTDDDSESKEESDLPKIRGMIPESTAKDSKLMSLPRLLPPIPLRSQVPKNFEKFTFEEKQIMAESLREDVLKKKGDMARLSEYRRSVAAAKRNFMALDKKSRIEEKLLESKAVKRLTNKNQRNVDEKLEKAKLNRERTEAERKAKIEKKLDRHIKPVVAPKECVEEKLERARLNREKRLAERRAEWETKEKIID